MGRTHIRADRRINRHIVQPRPSRLSGRSVRSAGKVGSAMSENIRDPEMIALEAALTELAPRPAGINRDQLMFQAGRRASRRCRLALPCASACFASTVTLLIVLGFSHQQPQFVEVAAPAVGPTARDQLAGADDGWLDRAEGLRLRNEVLEHGIDALPRPSLSEEREPPLT